MVAPATSLRCLAITGPTACGKTGLALSLAREFPVEIVSMDSAQVYRGMDIGTAKPDAKLRSEVPHHLLDIREPEHAYSAGDFAVDAAREIAAITARGRVALVVGGTLLYLRALREGIATLPPRDAATRRAIDDEAKLLGWPALHARLAAIDPVAAARIEPGDRQRIQRALEVHRLTGRPISELQLKATRSDVQVESVALMPGDRAAHARSIEQRFAAMIEQGFVDEVRALRERPRLTADTPSMRSVGYRQVWAWLDGGWEWEEAEQRAVAATRQLAKRQLTWLRGDAQTEKLDSSDTGLYEHLRRRLGRMLEGA